MQAPSQATSLVRRRTRAARTAPTRGASTTPPREPAPAGVRGADRASVAAPRTAPAGNRPPAPRRRRRGSRRDARVGLDAAPCAHRPRRARTTRVAVHLVAGRPAWRRAPRRSAGGCLAPRSRRRRPLPSPGSCCRRAARADAAGARRHQRADARAASQLAALSQSAWRRIASAPQSASGQADGCVLRERVAAHAGLEDAHHRRHVVEPALEALGVEDLRHEARSRPASACRRGRSGRWLRRASWRSTTSSPVSTQCRYQRFLSSSATFRSRTR